MRVMEKTTQRLRLTFQDTGILNKSQKKSGLKHSWVLLKPEFETISDVVSHICHSFDLHRSCPNGVILSMDGFVLPPFESTTILKDKDLISVKKKGAGKIKVLKANEEGRSLIEDKIVEKKPLPLGVRLLANEEFAKETKGNQIEKDEDEDEAEEPVLSAPGRDAVSKKRKASSSIDNLKKKRQRQVIPKEVQKKDVEQCDRVKTLQKKRKNSSVHKREGNVNCTKVSEPVSNEHEEKREDTIHAPGVSNGAKKVCRSTRRKRLQRKWKSSAAANEDKLGDKQIPVKDLSKELGSKKDLDSNTEQPAEEGSDADDDLVPVEIRPGHIRFARSSQANDAGVNEEANGFDVQSTQKCAGKDHTAEKNDWDVNKYKVEKESFCWNGITNKRKGQKWGKENQPTSWKESSHSSSSRAIRNQQYPSWKDRRDHNTHSSGSWASRKQPNNATVDFEKLAPMIDSPMAGDVIAYRLLELSSTWCPELSSFRVGRISCFEQESNKTIVVPDPEYPLNLEKKTDADQDGDDDSGQPPQPSIYKEDGSLEIDFPSLVDVRIVKRVVPSQSVTTRLPAANGTSAPSGLNKRINETEDGSKKVASDPGNQEPLTPAAPANGKKDVWEEISDALSAKKAQLLQEDSWNKKPTPTKRSWSSRTLKSSALGPTMARLRAQNGV